MPSVRVRLARSIACVRVVPFVVCGWFRLVELERRIVLPKFGNTDGYFGGWLLCEPGVAVSVAPVFSRQMTVCCNQGGHFLSRWFLLLLGRGRVKRRSPPIIEQFTVAVGVEAVRRLRIHYSESNKIAHFHQGNEFSHGLGRERPLDRSVHPAAEGIDVDIRVGSRRSRISMRNGSLSTDACSALRPNT